MRVHRLDAGLDAHEVLLAHQIRLVDQDAVCKGDLHVYTCMHACMRARVHACGHAGMCVCDVCVHAAGNLLDRLVLGALRLLLIQVLLDVLRVDESDNAVEPKGRFGRVVHEEGLRDRRRVGHARRLDDDPIQLQLARLDALGELGEDDDQVLAHCAADASVHHLDDLLVGLHLCVLREEAIIYAHIAKFVLDYGNLLAMGGRQNVVQQRRLAASQKTREDGDWHLVRRHMSSDLRRVGGCSKRRCKGTPECCVWSPTRQSAVLMRWEWVR